MGVNPREPKLSINCLIVSGWMGSAPQLATVQLLKSACQSFCRCTALRHASYEKFGPPLWVIDNRAIASSHRNGRRRKVIGDIR